MILALILDDTTITYLFLEWMLWIVIFVAGLAGLFTSLYILISHDDVKHRLV